MIPPPGMMQYPVANQAAEKAAQTDDVLQPPDDVPPSETLYLNNLNSRIKEKVWKPFLHKMFSTIGSCEIIVMSSLRRRGQAWVVYGDVNLAETAMKTFQGELVYGKKMRISFSRNMSDITRSKRGLAPRDKTSREAALEDPSSKRARVEETVIDSFFSTSVSAPKATVPSQTHNPPNKVLFVENISESTTSEQLSLLFSRFKGFLEARIIPGRGVAFVEFIDEFVSQVPLTRMHGHEMEPGRLLIVSNAKK
jgi:hypothetical protein